MNLALILAIAQQAIGIASKVGAGTVVEKDADIAASLMAIVQAGKACYEQHTGEAINVNLIQPEAPVE